jgi:outer membrane protein assembly factor BamE (lipoprotein component of BamABCDE complex)
MCIEGVENRSSMSARPVVRNPSAVRIGEQARVSRTGCAGAGGDFSQEARFMLRHVITDLAIAGCLFLLAGCLVTSSSQTRETGTAVSSSTLGQVEPGVTTKDWLLATLGLPTSRTAVDNQGNVEIFSYRHEVVRTSRGKVFLLFSGSSNSVETQKTLFELTDGVVTRYWTES